MPSDTICWISFTACDLNYLLLTQGNWRPQVLDFDETYGGCFWAQVHMT